MSRYNSGWMGISDTSGAGISHTQADPARLRLSCNMPTWVAASLRVPYSCWKAPRPAHAYRARNGVHLPARSHADQQHNTNYDSDGSESDSTWEHVDQCQSLKAVQLVRMTGRLKCRPFRFFLSKSGQISAYTLYRFCTRALVTEHWPNRPKGDLVPMMFGELWSCIDWSDLRSEVSLLFPTYPD